MMQTPERKSVAEIAAHKNREEPLACLTAYTAPVAKALDAHADMLLVGDSVAMVLYGKDSTRGASMPMMIAHGQAVMRATERACVIVDMPYGSYEDSDGWALRCAGTIMDKTGAQGVKLEGGTDMATRIETLVREGIPVTAHVGLLPQSVESPDGYRVHGRTDTEAEKVMEDARAVAEAGAFAIVLEGIPEPLAAAITAAVPVPTIGIGASAACDGQILVAEDMLGMTPGHKPKFVKPYADFYTSMEQAASRYARDVRARAFPDAAHTYPGKPKAA